MRYLGLVLLVVWCGRVVAQTVLRINQLGYQPKALKTAVLMTRQTQPPGPVQLCDALTGREVARFRRLEASGPLGAFAATYRVDFSRVQRPGAYFLRVGADRSPSFRIADDVYADTADFLLRYLRQQRCGFNPYLNDSCHVDDGFIVYHPDPTRDSTRLRALGGWHDASDYLKYVATSANAVYQLLLAYEHHPTAFGDAFDANGRPGKNGIPDVLDEAKWGLDWLIRLNPAPGEYYNQLADDRDHQGLRLPTRDPVRYDSRSGRPLSGRPVYFASGKPQGAFAYKSRATGRASTTGKYASAFALASRVLAPYYPALKTDLRRRALDAYATGQAYPGVCQTAPGRAPYFYEEDNWVDDMELAAAELHRLTRQPHYAREAVSYGRREPVTPWMVNDTARHYQWYPFLNVGHYAVAAGTSSPAQQRQFRAYLARGLRAIERRGADRPFRNGVPMIWCSNNLVTATLTQIQLYKRLGGGPTFDRLEAALRDYLFGCNPWGTSMVVGLPAGGDSPVDPHSAFTHLYRYPIDGGLVDGPVRPSIFRNLKYVSLHQPDEYAPFQNEGAVYHDDFGDYSTNEPTMDGTACLTYYLAAMAPGRPERRVRDTHGAVVRFDTTRPTVRLVFTAHEFTEGGALVRQTLRRQHIPAAFFLTGDAYRNPTNAALIRGLRADGHYLGAHSDRHLLYADWTRRDSLLVTETQFRDDLAANYREMARFGIRPADAPYFLPPYEWYNAAVTDWTTRAGLTLLNLTPGPSLQRDYTYPEMGRYVPTDTLLRQLTRLTDARPRALNGAVLLVHLGVDPRRPDPLYRRLDQLIALLKRRGYRFERL